MIEEQERKRKECINIWKIKKEKEEMKRKIEGKKNLEEKRRLKEEEKKKGKREKEEKILNYLHSIKKRK